MKLFRLVVLACLLLPVATAAEDELLSARLAPFNRLVGTVWVGAFPGTELIDEQEFEWVFEGRFLRNLHRVKNGEGAVVYQGETIYAWDVTTDTLVWWYWNSTGGFVTGTLSQTEDGWSFDGINHAPPPQPAEVKGLFRLIDPDTWESVQYFMSEDGWQERFTMVFRPREAAED